MLDGPFDVAGQIEQLAGPDPAAYQRVAIRLGGEQHRLGGELPGRGVGGPGVRCGGGRIQGVRDGRVRPCPGGQRREVRIPLRAGRDGGQPLVEVRSPARRQQLHGGRTDQRVRHRDPVPRLDKHAGEYRRVEGAARIVQVAEDRKRLGYPDAPGGRHHGQRLGGIGAQRTGEPPGHRAGQFRNGWLTGLGGCPRRIEVRRDLKGPERVAAGLPGHQPRLGGGDRLRQQILDLPHVQRGEVDLLRRVPRGQQLTPAPRRCRVARRQRIGRRFAPRGQQDRQGPAVEAPQREHQRIEACLVQPLHVVDRDQHRARGHAGP